jgi:hypothetical protein
MLVLYPYLSILVAFIVWPQDETFCRKKLMAIVYSSVLVSSLQYVAVIARLNLALVLSLQ